MLIYLFQFLNDFTKTGHIMSLRSSKPSIIINKLNCHVKIKLSKNFPQKYQVHIVA